MAHLRLTIEDRIAAAERRARVASRIIMIGFILLAVSAVGTAYSIGWVVGFAQGREVTK